MRSIVPTGMTESVDYYEVLGIEVTASNDDIRKAYKEQAMRWHPDKASAKNKEAATERFKVVSAAFEELSDAGKRENYDQRRATNSDCRKGHSVALDEAWEIFIRGILHSGGSTYTLRPSLLPDYDPAMTKGKPGKIWNCLATWMIRREISKNSAKGKGPLDPHTK
eukprot:gene571-1988_t